MIEVGIAIYKGTTNLRLILEGLTHQTFNDFKVRIVCDGGDYNLEKVVKEYQNRLNVFFYYFPPETTERRVPEAKNMTATKADRSVKRVLIIDGDCVPAPNVVASHATLLIRR